MEKEDERVRLLGQREKLHISLMTAEEKGKCSTVFRERDTKASLYS